MLSYSQANYPKLMNMPSLARAIHIWTKLLQGLSNAEGHKNYKCSFYPRVNYKILPSIEMS